MTPPERPSLRRRVYLLLEGPRVGGATRVFDALLLALVFANVAASAAATDAWLHAEAPGFFDGFEVVSVAVFSLEYALRLWCCVEGGASPVLGRLRFALRPMMLVDLLAIAPFYIERLIDLRAVRALRLFRIFRVIKVGRYFAAADSIVRALRSRAEELVVIVATVVLLLIVSSSILYYCEFEAQPQEFSSIPQAMWWSIATLTTVGYGDVYPITPLGKLFAAVSAVLGVGLVALPAGIISGAFLEQLHERRVARHGQRTCPHCGGSLEPES